MTLPRTTPLERVLSEARDIAEATEQPLTTAHVLLAFFTVENSAGLMLRDHGVDEDVLLDEIEGRLREPDDALAGLFERAEQIAAGCGGREVDCLHVLVAMTRAKRTVAQLLLEGTEIKLGRLRTRALAILTGSVPRWVADEEPARETVASHVRRGSRPSRRPVRSELPIPGLSSAIQWTPPRIAPRPTGAYRRSSPPPHFKGASDGARSSGGDGVSLSGEASELPRSAAPIAPPLAPSYAPSGLGAAWALDPTEYPWLSTLGRNLSAEAARGGLDELVGREREVDALIDILGKRRTNNPCLLGEPGVGKTAVVEGLALRLVKNPPTPALGRAILVELDVGALLVGTHLRGSFSEKLQGIKDEVKRSKGRVIIFFDELHTLVGAGSSGDGAQDAANELKAALSRGEFPCVGATTLDEWKKHIEQDPALSRRFHPVLVKEPSIPEAIEMIGRLIAAYGEHHGVDYLEDAVHAAVTFSVRYIIDRHLPDKAIALLDLAGSRAARAGETVVDRRRVAEIVAERADLPIERVLSSDRSRLLELERHLAREVVGHGAALARIADVVRRNAAGFGSRRPQGSFLFLGPTGVGKTETAKALAKILHGTEEAMLRFDLSEYSEPHSVARLVGAPPGYVGYDAGGQLTEAIRRRPAAVLLFDEVEKAHREVLQVFLQILDEGRLTDGRGRTVSFAETIVVMTSNLGADLAKGKPLGFGSTRAGEQRAAVEAAIIDEARRRLAPELWARIEERLIFAPLVIDEVREVARRLARASSARLAKERGIRFELDDAAVDFLIQEGGFDLSLGARPMRQILARIVEAPIAARILEGRLHADEQVLVTTRERGGLTFLVGEDRTSLSQRPPARSMAPPP
ncbi:MAG: ATP-dependent Clp protease ATP-binding subunit [Deltaproteobacteria bacterium]|nr:ATP-dependent Clp protease ATP-binding subunit [Deltaproteobacteria bacterium]